VIGWVLAGAAATVLLDQTTKALAVRFLSPVRVAGGSSWTGRAPAVPVLVGLWFTTLACTVLVLAASTASSSERLAAASLVVAFGGATGNLVDRLARGAVIDFIDLGWWPAFNLADVAIVAGVVVGIGAVL
jgi:signal peptidase II